MRFHSSTVMSAAGRNTPLPALLTRISRPPSSLSALRNRSRTASLLLTSTVCPDTFRRGSALCSSLTAASRASLSRPQIITSAPASISARAVANPIPFVPPVISARLLVRNCVIFSLYLSSEVAEFHHQSHHPVI